MVIRATAHDKFPARTFKFVVVLIPGTVQFMPALRALESFSADILG